MFFISQHNTTKTALCLWALLACTATAQEPTSAESKDIQTASTTDTDIDVHSRDEYGRTPLMLCTMKGQKDAICRLLQAGADINAQDNEGNTALMYAVSFVSPDTKYPVLPSASQHNWAAYDNYDRAVANLYLRQSLARSELTKLLLKAGANPDISNKQGTTPLMSAIDHQPSHYVLIRGGVLSSMLSPTPAEMLIEHGCKITAVDHSGKTALEYAAEQGHSETITQLQDSLTEKPGALRGHRRAVYTVAFSPDGKQLASGSEDHTIRLWNVQTQQCLAEFMGGSDIKSVAFSPDGKRLASASFDGNVHFWSLETQKCLAARDEHKSSVFSVTFSPDGKWLASASQDKTIRLWDAEMMQNLTTLRGHEDIVFSVTFSPDGKQLASASFDKTIRLWDIGTLQCLAVFRGHEDSVFSVAFSPDGKQLASASHDRTVRLWDVETRQCFAVLKGHEDQIRSVAFSPEGKQLASASRDNTIRLWNVETQQCLAVLKGHKSLLYTVAFSPDGRSLVSSSHDKTIRLWSIPEDIAPQPDAASVQP